MNAASLGNQAELCPVTQPQTFPEHYTSIAEL